MPNLVNDFEVRKETLRALGGNPDGLANIYEVDLEILKLIGSGGSGIDWDTIKQKLAEDGVESIKFTMTGEDVILTAEEVKTLLKLVISEEKYLTITVDESNSGETIIHPNVNGDLPNLNLQYRVNGGDWTDFIVGTTADITAQPGDVIQLKGNNPNGLSADYTRLNFSISDSVHLSGNIMSLIDGVGETTVVPNRLCFYELFKNSMVKTVSEDFLPATTLQEECYRDLFSGCQKLTQAPALPAMELKTLCYSGMYYNCTSLQKSPDLNAKVLSEDCYQCMFKYCYSLNYLKCLAESGISSSSLLDWLVDVAASGVFEKPAGVVYPTGGSGIPVGWTINEIAKYTEAPMDGKTYGRNNGNWTPVESGYPIKQGVQIDNNVVSVENYGQYTRLHGNFIEIEKNNEGNIRLYDKLEVTIPGEESKTASFIDILNAGNGVVKTTNNTTLKFWSGTQQEYDAITTKDTNTLYVIS